jgi:GTP1/Obg family GTP-binding protein
MAVFAMDFGLCLLGILAGVIAFAVDFSSGCIYLPEHQVSLEVLPNEDIKHWRVVKVDPDTLNQATIERIIREQTGKSIQLNSPDLLMF